MKKKTKNKIRIFVAIILSSITVFVGIYTYGLFKLGFFKNHSNIEINELTKQQKIDDIKYLIGFVYANSPYVDFIHSEKGLRNIHPVERDFIQKAANSKNNREYLEVVLEYLMILQQIGHAGLLEISGKPNKSFDYWPIGLKYDLPAKSFNYQHYWNELSKQINAEKKWYHNELNTLYESGFYKVGLNNLDVPEGSILRSIDNIDVDSFVYSHWTSYILRFDTRLRKSFCFAADPLITNNDTTKAKWKIDLTTPLKEHIIVDIPKLDGFRQRSEIPNLDGNVKCVHLTPEIAYIKIKSFVNYPQYLNDFSTIDSFLKASEGKIEKLIIDVRNNRGGAPKYWQKMFIERFIKNKQPYVQYAAIKKKAYGLLKERRFIQRLFSSQDITQGKSERISLNEIPLDIKKYNSLNDKEWYFFRNTIVFTPKKDFRFNGKCKHSVCYILAMA